MDLTTYLSQAMTLDRTIDSKLAQISALRSLATRVASVISDSPVTHSRELHSMESTICRIIDMENELNAAIDDLILLRTNISRLIDQLPDPTLRAVLELRYLCFKNWDTIASDMSYTRSNVLKLHKKALDILSEIYIET